MPEIKHVSVSQCRKFKMCPLQWFYHYVEKIREPVSSRMLLGIAVHKGLAQASVFRQAGLEVGSDDVMHEVLNATYAEADVTVEGKEMLWDDASDVGSMDDLKARAKRVLSRAVPALMHNTGAPKLIEAPLPPIMLECGIPLVGYGDLVDDNGEIYDFKCGAKAKSLSDVDGDLQLSVYAYGFTEDFKDDQKVPVHLVSVNSGTGEVKKVTGSRDKHQAESAIKELNDTAELMMCGVYPANTEGWWCSSKFCAAWKVCPHGGGR